MCYWAKASLFKNPLTGWMLTSAGSIPVHRNSNRLSQPAREGEGDSQPKHVSHADLFRHTTEALQRGEVVGIFPEGTSHSEPALTPFRDGTAWAVIEYARAARMRSRESDLPRDEVGLVVVPVAVVYTDKSRYQSQVGCPASSTESPVLSPFHFICLHRFS